MANPATIFLDFDGVLHPFGIHWESPKTFSNIPLLEEFLRRHEHIEVVLSTTWSTSHTLDENRARFSTDIAHRITDHTPLRIEDDDVPDHHLPYVRERECWFWMNRNRPMQADDSWIGIDDDSWRFSPFCENLCLTNENTGLIQRDILNLEERLGRISR